METKDSLTNYYESYDEEGRLLSKYGMVEYITTMKYIERYLQHLGDRRGNRPIQPRFGTKRLSSGCRGIGCA